ncbi:MAG: sterol desaturase family protein [Rhizobiales bacterium]|nr:sterol desaturase family protein [Hyphomicrobiales bacterium]
MIFPDPKMIILAVLVFVPLERLFALRRDQSILRSLWQLDSIYMLFNSAITGLGISVLLFTTLLLSPHLVPQEFRSWVGSQPVWVQLPVMILLADLGFYAIHRLFHKIPWLWKFHAVHHSIEEMDWLAAHRVHPVDQILTKGVSFLPVFALGFSAAPIAAYAFLYHWQSLLIHSNVRIGFGPIGRIFATPRFHHWHHANQPQAYDKNFAGQLSFLDAVFGTLHMPAANMPKRYGTDEPVPHSYGAQLMFPFQQSATGNQPQPSGELAKIAD